MKLTLSNFSACKCRAAKTNNNANSLSSFKNSSQATSINYAPIYYKSTINNAFSFKGLDEARERELSELVVVFSCNGIKILGARLYYTLYRKPRVS